MQIRIGNIVSYCFHPIIVVCFTFWFIIFQSKSVQYNQYIIFLISIIFIAILPIVNVLYLKHKKLISDIDASKKDERLLPLAFGALFFLIGFIILKKLNSPLIIQGMMFSSIINTIIIWLITRKWKISIHLITLSWSFAIFLFAGFVELIVMILATSLVSYARYILKAHTLGQLIIGLLLGLISTYTQLILLF